jgi:hypothetical protein
VEGRKRYEFLEALVSSMDAHVRFFERGHHMLSGLEPYIQQSLEVSGRALSLVGARYLQACFCCSKDGPVAEVKRRCGTFDRGTAGQSEGA